MPQRPGTAGSGLLHAGRQAPREAIAWRLVAIHLIRHAHAGSRSDWDGDDRERPLSQRGQLETAHLVELLADAAIGAVVSSPATRCTQTAEPIATDHGLRLDIHPALAEGSDIDKALALLYAEADRAPVLCSHGDIIPPLLHALADQGMRADVPLTAGKGSLWILEVADGRVTEGRYLPPAG